MAVMTKTDVERLIKDTVGAQLADFRQEMEGLAKVQRQFAHGVYRGEQQQARAPEPGLRFARFVRALAAGRGDPEKAAKIVKGWLDRTKSPVDEALHKALAESTLEDGGAITPDEYVAEIIELLRARTVVRGSGAMVVPMNSGSMTMPRQTGAGTAYYVGENQNITASQQTFGQLQMSAKKLAALTPISNDLIRDASPQADTIVRDDLVAVMGLREDLAFLRDDGTQNKPKGIRYWAAASNVFAATQAGATATLDEITADLTKMIRLVEEANVPMVRCGWLMTPRLKWFLMSRRDGNGNLVFAPEMERGTLYGFPFRTTTQIPNNLGAGSNESELYFGDFQQAVIGENTQLLVDVFRDGTYHDGSQVVSGISAEQTVIRTIARHDFVLRHDQAFAVLTGVKWGA